MKLHIKKTSYYLIPFITLIMLVASCGDNESLISGDWLVSEDKEVTTYTNGKPFLRRLIMRVGSRQVSMVAECEFDGKKAVATIRSEAIITDSEFSILSSDAKSTMENGIFCAAIIQAGNFSYIRDGNKLTITSSGTHSSQTFQKIR